MSEENSQLEQEGGDLKRARGTYDERNARRVRGRVEKREGAERDDAAFEEAREYNAGLAQLEAEAAALKAKATEAMRAAKVASEVAAKVAAEATARVAAIAARVAAAAEVGGAPRVASEGMQRF